MYMIGPIGHNLQSKPSHAMEEVNMYRYIHIILEVGWDVK